MDENRHICRAKRDPDGRWFEGYYVMLQGIDTPFASDYRPHRAVYTHRPRDSRRVYRLIFEGDIICEGNSNEPLIVTYDGQLGRFECYDEKADLTWTFVDVNPDLIEIIGNVHEEQMKL